ncbi:MAG: PTS glucose transporter subunit IIA [Clostridia bacterium]|nr:PTS glucose transporter subunit IIA [Clostridia bacterium]MBO5671289.1 PTS glucose transporter subunit IIA [Clostridia bacterium]
MDKRKNRGLTLCAPGSGQVISGDSGGCTIAFADERNGDVVSPVSGVVTRVGQGDNSIALRADMGIAVSLAIGSGRRGGRSQEGCHYYVREGELVHTGQRLLHAELDRIRRLGGDTVCTMAVSGGRCGEMRRAGDAVRAGVTPVVHIPGE